MTGPAADHQGVAQSLESAPIGLTTRQTQVLALIARGYSSKEIGRELGVSPKTVDRHVEVINQRLGTDSRAAAARHYMDWLARHGEDLPMGTRSLAPSATIPAGLAPAAIDQSSQSLRWWALPSLGGKRQSRTIVETGAATLKVSAFGLLAVLALLLLASGLMHFFS